MVVIRILIFSLVPYFSCIFIFEDVTGGKNYLLILVMIETLLNLNGLWNDLHSMCDIQTGAHDFLGSLQYANTCVPPT